MIHMAEIFLMSNKRKKVLASDILSLLEMTDEARMAGDQFGRQEAVDLSKEIVKTCSMIKDAQPGTLWEDIRRRIICNVEADIRLQLDKEHDNLECLLEVHNALKRSRDAFENGNPSMDP